MDNKPQAKGQMPDAFPGMGGARPGVNPMELPPEVLEALRRGGYQYQQPMSNTDRIDIVMPQTSNAPTFNQIAAPTQQLVDTYSAFLQNPEVTQVSSYIPYADS